MGRGKSGKKFKSKKFPADIIQQDESSPRDETAGNERGNCSDLRVNLSKKETCGNAAVKSPAADEPSVKPAKAVISPQERAKGGKKAPGAPSPSIQSSSGRGIGPAVFLPCLFLALVLGIFLGTLLPGMLDGNGKKMAMEQEFETQKQMGAPANDASAAAPSAAPAAAPGDPVSSLLARTAASPNDVHAWIDLGNAYFDRGEPKNSIAAYQRALSLNPNHPDAVTDMGIMYRELGDYSEAIDCFRRAQKLDPRHANAMFNEGVVLLNDLKKPAEARKAWEKLVQINPEARSPDGKLVKDILRLMPAE